MKIYDMEKCKNYKLTSCNHYFKYKKCFAIYKLT